MKNYRVPESIKHDFQTRFVNHKASKTEYKQESGDGVITVINLRRPDSSRYAIRYILAGNSVYISGDCGTAVFQLTEKAELTELAKYNLSYFASKLVTSDMGDTSFLCSAFAEDIREDANIDVVPSVRERLVYMASHFNGGRKDWAFQVKEMWLEGLMSQPVYEYVAGLWGYNYVSFSLYAWFMGLKVAQEQFWLEGGASGCTTM